MSDETIYLGVDQVAKRLGFHPETIRRWANNGKLPGRKFGQQWRFTQDDIDQVGVSKEPEHENSVA